VWAYTLLLPSFARSGWLPMSFIEQGPLGVALLKPLQLFGLSGLDQISHCLFWSMLANIGAYVWGSLTRRPSVPETSQASAFVDAFRRSVGGGSQLWRGSASVDDLFSLVSRFLGPAKAARAFEDYARDRGLRSFRDLPADAKLVHFAETLLAGAIGSASARVMVSSTVKEEPLGIDEVMNILDEASQVIAYSHKLEQQSRELEAATAELRAANERLKELDRMKDDFISTVTHELRTPLTSIRAFSEILLEDPQGDAAQRRKFLGIIVKEAERLTRLINQVLDLAKLESGKAEWHATELSLREVIEDSVAATSSLSADKGVRVEARLPERVPLITADRDRLMQVMINLLSNAVKFCKAGEGLVQVRLLAGPEELRVEVQDNGPGIAREHHEAIFDKFHQVGDTMTEKPQGTGLGLPISRQIIGHFGGRMWVNSEPGKGATFAFTLPRRVADAAA
ncbi:MAG TPA: HAMP domain-containing sensor histidine kinase, partial [Burkholderiales bacterium]